LRSLEALIRVLLERLIRKHVLKNLSERLFDMIGRLTPIN